MEPDFWRSGKKIRALSQYRIPSAYDEEILIEKSPLYMRGELKDLENRAKNMKITIPDLKFLVFLCNPVKRILSWIKQLEAYYEYTGFERYKAYKELNLTSKVVWYGIPYG